MYLIFNSLKNQWLGFVLIFFMTLFWVSSDKEIKRLEDKAKEMQLVIKDLEEKDHATALLIDSLSKQDTVLLTKIKLIKEKEYETIRIIDSLPVSKLQEYFADRYKR
jgi:hypothetical protein